MLRFASSIYATLFAYIGIDFNKIGRVLKSATLLFCSFQLWTCSLSCFYSSSLQIAKHDTDSLIIESY